MKDKIDLSINLGSLHLMNPVMPASGTFDIRDTLLNKEQLNSLGAIIIKSITSHKRMGNPGPRIWETEGGMLNAVGIPTEGFEYFEEEILPLLEDFQVPIIVSIVGDSIADFCQLAKKLDGFKKISALELNLSCPNLNDGLYFGINKDVLGDLIYQLKKNTEKVVMAKLSPNVTDITEMALTAEEAGADIVIIANTFLGMAIDIEKQIPRLGNKAGGLSGPGIRPIIVRMIWEVAQRVKIPVIGVGGVTCTRDALEMLLAGASAVQIGSANFSNPYVMLNVIKGIEEYFRRKKYKSIRDIIGLVK
jgi:dihydroorotate dehydrogenase (NAD+) catalytic subunit